MRRSLVILCILFSNAMQAQDSIVKHWNHEIEVNAYLVNLIRYGGLELDYGFGRKIGNQSELGIKTGVFYMVRNTNQFSYLPAYLYYRFYFKKHKASLSFDGGTPLIWFQDDSRIIDGMYWNNDNEVDDPIYRVRIWLINHFEYEYYLSRKWNVSIGISNYFTQVSADNLTYTLDESKRRFRINPGFKFGISYRF